MAWHRSTLAVAALVVGPTLAVAGFHAQSPSPGRPAPAPASGGHAHGTPAGWKFSWPKGDPVRGREVFVKLECYSCHEVRGEGFPKPGDRDKVGPELSAMGPLHAPEYFAEAIVNPSAVIEPGRGYEAPDGSSKMPSYSDSVTLQEVVDLVAYLVGLEPPADGPPPASGSGGGHPGH